MNRPSNIPPNMSRHHHLHGHHNIRAPPPPLQSVAPPHALPIGYPPPPLAANMPPQQRPTRAQNYHTFMDNSNSGGGGGAPPFVHYSRMGGNQTSNKKYNQLKQRTPKPAESYQHHHQHQVPQTSHNYSTVQYKTDMQTNKASSLKITNENRRPSQHPSPNPDSYPSSSKKMPEIVPQFEASYQQTPLAVASKSNESKGDEPEFQSNSMKLLKQTEETVTAVGSTISEGPKVDDCQTNGDDIIETAEETEGKEGDDDDDEDEDHDHDKTEEDLTTADADKDSASFKSSREKTPMCLVNDLARFNKISFQYRLTGENGPAHCKRFTVTLKLGDEEYIAEGLKIKVAQHLAAKEAIRRTKYKHPIPKTNRRNEDQSNSRVNVTPTVELNALAMKLGLQTYYIFDPRQSPHNAVAQAKGVVSEKGLQQRNRVPSVLPAAGGQSQLHSSANFGGGTFVPSLTHQNQAIMRIQQATGHHRGPFPHCYPVLPPHMVAATQHLNSTIFPTPCRITLIVGTQKFMGIGRTIQQAKHDAAAQAIESLKEQMDNQQKDVTDEKSSESDNKSPISLVFEIGIKRNLPVDFKILREDGPAHMRTFTTACIVGQIVTEAEGTGKKISKKKAAQKMLEELNKLPPVTTPVNSPTKRVKPKTAAPRKSGASHAKQTSVPENKETNQRGGGGGGVSDSSNKPKKRASESESDSSNPITKLIELFQHNKEKEPVFKLITESGKERSRQRQFVVEVSSKDTTARGVGNSKKSARRNAAQNFLMSLGLDVKDTSSSPPTLASTAASVGIVEKKTEKGSVSTKAATAAGSSRKSESKQGNSLVATKELINDEATDLPTVKDMSKSVEQPSSTTQPAAYSSSQSSSSTSVTTAKPTVGFHMKDKLLYLARLMGFEVDFSDYPKGNHNEFLSIVMISTNPPQICHGIGANAMESQEDAASNALKILSEMGLNK